MAEMGCGVKLSFVDSAFSLLSFPFASACLRGLLLLFFGMKDAEISLKRFWWMMLEKEISI